MKPTNILCRECGLPWVTGFEFRQLVTRPSCQCGAETVRWTHEMQRAKYMLLTRWRDGFDLAEYVETFDPDYESRVSPAAMALAYECGKRWGWFKQRPVAAAVVPGLYGPKYAEGA